MSMTERLDARAERSALIEESILPIRAAQRPIGALGYAWIWVGIAVIIATYSLGATGIQGGFGLGTVALTILLANLAIGAFMLLTADIGTEHGISFAVYLRAPFGIHGTHLPAVSRGLVAAMWFGIQTYLGALALNGIGEYFLGFSNWFLWYAAFAAVQVANTMLGIRSVERLAALAAPAIIAISVWMYFTLEGIAETKGLNIWTFRAEGQASLIVLFIANMSFWSTMAIDIPNLTRFVHTRTGTRSFLERNRSIFLAQLVALPATQAMIAGIGAISFIATGNWNPVEVIQGDAQGLALLALLVLVVLAQWSTNNSANLIPAALTFVNLAPRVISYRGGVALAGVVGTLCFPWQILDNLFMFLGYYGAFLSAIGGIMVADYHAIRRRRVNVPALFDLHGQYRYFSGVNPAGMVAWLVAGGIAAWWSAYAFVIGFPLGFLLYLFLMRTWVLPQYRQEELADRTGDDFLAASVGMDWVHVAGGRFVRKPCGAA
ncbi:NCS1 family transporter [Paracoccus denitrificans]|uniref:Permease for cytosine/purines, uracil, thiamine, allantoin n=1 Tax=Paracoccus denitrificans (strain Pd 1222) TaxID=318586 RepID=A1BA71_PARDP|nr:NCS1 family transporter [Paracoccus denitrificans]ABL72415.1 permease for cytosine/purines, uracil, thiamine, allantoin [Paracoccus denitrificans PD1222]QAR28970.1 nitrate reductase [Paracoccus denitrificans]SDJ04990.1 nucleobase:cation symporter-1, NCS1 family [Paracoccus denitrificans]SFR13098.1 nucleobase:cation symporter-1, NCS1 family [Paracoccus denitrificans]